MHAKREVALYVSLALVAILVLCWVVYAPGLNGGFLFDDFANLDALGNDGPIHDWNSFLRYITSGVADPTGRPLTLLSFLMDAQNWPADPQPFKRTSLLLHLLNGALLFRACRSLLDQSTIARGFDIRLASALCAALWLVHPLFVSTVLYVVQREAILPATFTLCALLAWCHGRKVLSEGRGSRGMAWLIFGAWVCTVLATLCKANGILIPILIGTAECTLLRKEHADKRFIAVRRVLVGAPIVALIATVLLLLPGFERSAVENRPWTLTQRLISEPRFLLDYLHLLWVPRATSFGIFNDQVRASTSLVEPWTTLPSLVLIVGAAIAGWLMRKRYPILAFALLFFLAGQLLESTVLPLELAFEHRNYLPALFIFLPLGCWLARDTRRSLRLFFAASLIAVLSLLTYERATVWGDRYQQALIWAQINPDSARAQALAASIELERGQGEQAVSRLRRAIEKAPSDVQLTLNLAQTECQLGAVSDATWSSVLRSLAQTTNNARTTYEWFVTAVRDVQSNLCQGVTLPRLHEALAAARSNPKFGHQRGRQQDYWHVDGIIALAENDGKHALEAFDRAIAETPNRGIGLLQTGLLATAGFKKLALEHLEFTARQPAMGDVGVGMPRIHAWVLDRQHFWDTETDALRKTLMSELQDSKHDDA